MSDEPTELTISGNLSFTGTDLAAAPYTCSTSAIVHGKFDPMELAEAMIEAMTVYKRFTGRDFGPKE